MKKHTMYPITLKRRKKASTILLVLSILSVLILLSIMMTFTSRLEQQAAGNFARGIQDRSATRTGVAPLLPALALYLPPGPTGPLDTSFNRDFIEYRFESLDGGISPFDFQNNSLLLASNSATGSSVGDLSGIRANQSNPLQSYFQDQNNNSGPNTNQVTIPDSDNPVRDYTEDIPDPTPTPDFVYPERVMENDEPIDLSGVAYSESSGFGDGTGMFGNNEYLSQVITPTGEVFIQDAGAYININTASLEHLRNTLRIVSREFGHQYDPVALANAIVDLRYGPDNAPGFAGIDDDFDADESVSLGEVYEEEFDLRLSRSFVDDDSHYYETRSAERLSQIQEALERVKEPLGVYTASEVQQRQQMRFGLLSGIDEADEYVSDIRNEPYGDDIRIENLMELLDYPETASTGITTEEIRDLHSVLTVFNASIREHVVDGRVYQMTDINRASPEEIYRALTMLYGEGDKNEILLRQFAVNLVDARDTDSIPTQYPDSAFGVDIFGVERTPLITEIYADSRTPIEYGDDGQFIELYNPWSEPIRIAGWHLRGAGLNVMLSGSIPPQGYLIITDDLDGTVLSDQDDLDGTGSFYDIFGLLPDGLRRQVKVVPSLSLIDVGSQLTVELENEDGDVVDVFRWSSEDADEDSLYSYQRRNPVIREAIRASATPFNKLRTGNIDSEALERLAQGPQNGPFVSVADILTVFTGFADPTRKVSQLDTFPVIGTPDSEDEKVAELAGDRNRLDARLMNVFDVYMSDPEPSTSQKNAANKSRRSDIDEEGVPILSTRIEQLERAQLLRIEPKNIEPAKTLSNQRDFIKYLTNEGSGQQPATQFGRLNLNTAGPLALQSIPGFNPTLANKIVQRREELISSVRRGQLSDAILFHEYSDILDDPDIMASANTDAEKIKVMRDILPFISLNSQTFRIITQPRVEEGTSEETQMSHRMEGLITKDRILGEIVYYRDLFQ